MTIVDRIATKLEIPSPLEPLITDWTNSSQIFLYVKRDDLIHPHLSGNKWRKLKYAILEMENQNKNGLITFGGAFSNHLVATAMAGHTGHFKTVGIIRTYHQELNNPTLSLCREYGMKLHFVAPDAYSSGGSSVYIKRILNAYTQLMLIPEGGTSRLCLPGIQELYDEILEDLQDVPDYIVTSVGSGGTLAGLVKAVTEDIRIIGLAPFKSKITSIPGLSLIQNSKNNYEILPSALPRLRFGGYNQSLIEYINAFTAVHNIRLDPIYTGRGMMKLEALSRDGFFRKDSVIVFIHTGGQQGIAGYNQRFLKKGKNIK